MINGELRSKVDKVWDAFWSGGISNPLSAIEQITYLLFIRRLDDIQRLQENKASEMQAPIEDPIFAPEQTALRWSTFKNFDAQTMFTTVKDEVFPFLKRYAAGIDGSGSTYSEQLKDATFQLPNAALLAKVVDLLDEIPMTDRDTNGDLYEYLLSQLSSAGKNGQYRTPRHLINLIVDLAAPSPTDEICDPASGSAGFLVAAAEYIRKQHPEALTDAAQRAHFHQSMFHGYDNDQTMVRIGAMNMLMHGIEQPDLLRQDSLAEPVDGGTKLEADRFSLVLANPPFAGSLDKESVSSELQRVVKTTKTELLFLAAIIKMLQPGGRAAVIVPDGVLFGSSKAHTELRRILVEDQKLDAVVKLQAGFFKPYAGVSTAVLFFTKTNSGGTDEVWFYDVQNDGFSLDDKRTPIEANDLDDVRARWPERAGSERDRPRTARSFTVPKAEIAAQNYDLSLNRYKEVEYEAVDHRDPADIIADIERLDGEIADGLAELKALLK